MGKKNFRVIPTLTEESIKEIKNRFIKVGRTIIATQKDIVDGKYKKLGITFINNKISYKNEMLPDKKSGRFSKYNFEGRVVPRYDLPKIKKTFSIDYYPWGNTDLPMETAYYEKPVAQKEILLPEYLIFSISLVETKDDEYTFKIEINSVIDKMSADFNEELLKYINICQENLSGYSVYSEDDEPEEELIKSTYVNWNLLPPKPLGIEYFKTNFPQKTDEEHKVAYDRYKYLLSLKPKQLFRGPNSFNYYFGAEFDNGIVILENINVGNALYIIYQDWETISKLSRTEIIALRTDKVDRVLHTKNWMQLANHLLSSHK